MSEQKKIPAPILDTIAKAAEHEQTAAEAGREEQAFFQTVTALERELADLQLKLTAARAAHEAAAGQRTEAAEFAEHYNHMAYGRARSLEIPVEQMDAALRAARDNVVRPAPAAPPSPAAEQPKRGTCLHCSERIHLLPGGEWWLHDRDGAAPCDSDKGDSPFAEPVPVENPLNLNDLHPDRRPAKQNGGPK